MTNHVISVDALTQEDDETIGFVLSAYYSGAISMDELRTWGLSVIERLDVERIPPYMFDLIDVRSPLDLHRIIGFYPSWKESSAEEAAMVGITLRRGRDKGDARVSTARALRLVDELPYVADAFERIFSFLPTGWRSGPPPA